jgi:hypothetical protein
MRRIVSTWIVLMAFGAVPAAVLAQVPSLCTAPAAGDADLDGFSNAQECAVLNLATGLQLAANASTSVAPCVGGESAAQRALCLHPSGRDLFWIDQTGTLPLPADTFVALGRDLGITFHRLLRTVAGTERTVSTASTQKALQITTDPDSASGVLGRANWGTPNNLDGTTIYPNRVANYVNGLCPAGTVCQASTGQVGAAAIIPVLTRWVADHEVGHTLALSGVFDSRFGGYHEASGSLTVMEQSPKVVSKRGSVTFYVANVFSSASVTDAKLAGTQ